MTRTLSLNHRCTRACLRSVGMFGRRWYSCARTPTITVRVPRLRRA